MEEQKKTKGLKKAEGLIEENSKYFRFYELAPKGVSCTMAILLLIVGAIIGAVEEWYVFLVSLIVAPILCLPMYFALKIAFSYKILHIAYLEKIEKNIRIIEEQ